MSSRARPCNLHVEATERCFLQADQSRWMIELIRSLGIAGLDRRLRNRLLQPLVPADARPRRAQDRQVIRGNNRHRRRNKPGCAAHYRHGSFAGAGDRRRGHRNRNSSQFSAQSGRSFRPRLAIRKAYARYLTLRVPPIAANARKIRSARLKIAAHSPNLIS